MKKALLSLALAALSANVAFAQLTAKPIPDVPHGPYFITEAYLTNPDCEFVSAPGSVMGPVPGKGPVVDNKCFTGSDEIQNNQDNIRAVPGILCLGDRRQLGFNVNDFVTGHDPFVQSFRLIKTIPLQPKCPEIFSGARFIMFGPEIRTWWTLIYTAPGTTFRLEILVVDRGVPGHEGEPVLHRDVWTWEVVASFQSLLAVIHALHQNTLGTTEVPCISGEDMHASLVASVESIQAGLVSQQAAQVAELLAGIEHPTPEQIAAAEAEARRVVTETERALAQDRLFNFEALVTSFCSFCTFFVPEECFSVAFPPSDDIQFGDFGFTGIVDTIENPCCCKLLADIDYIGLRFGITSR